MKKVLFKEEQRYTQWWLWLIMVFVLLSVIIPLVKVISEEQSQITTSNARLFLYVAAAVIFVAVFIIITLLIRLKTKITYDGIYVAFVPFIGKWKKISLDEIARYELRKYSAFGEFGGYGMKTRRKAGKAYTISGNMGLQLYFKDGKKLLIGTRKKQAMEYAMLKFAGEKLKILPNESVHKNTSTPLLGRKAKKFLIILAIEFAIIILIFAITQIFK